MLETSASFKALTARGLKSRESEEGTGESLPSLTEVFSTIRAQCNRILHELGSWLEIEIQPFSDPYDKSLSSSELFLNGEFEFPNHDSWLEVWTAQLSDH